MNLIRLILLIFSIVLSISQIAFGYDYEENTEEENEVSTDIKSEDELIGPANVTIRWNELGFKVVCEEDEWKEQFDSIKAQMVDCLEVNEIVYEVTDEKEFEQKRNMAMLFGKPSENPYCWLGKNWARCRRYMLGLECIEPDPKSLMNDRRTSRLKEMAQENIPNYASNDPYDWANMVRPYKIICEIAKMQSKSNLLGSMGAWF